MASRIDLHVSRIKPINAKTFTAMLSGEAQARGLTPAPAMALV
jgi:hypothetical protein